MPSLGSHGTFGILLRINQKGSRLPCMGLLAAFEIFFGCALDSHATPSRHKASGIEAIPASSFLHSVKVSVCFTSSLYLLIIKLRYSLYTCGPWRVEFCSLLTHLGLVETADPLEVTVSTCMQVKAKHPAQVSRITLGVLDCALPLKKSGTDLRSTAWMSL